MRLVPSLFVAAAVVLGASAPSTAYQPTVVVPGGVWTRTVEVDNPTQSPRTVSARVRVRGHPFWSSPSQRAVRGEWVEIPAFELGAFESREIELDIPVPETAPIILTVEIRLRGGGALPVWNYRPLALVEGLVAPPRGGRERGIPFRIVGGGDARYPEYYEEFDEVTVEAVRDTSAWDSLRERVGILSPDSWGLHPDENDRWPGSGTRRAEFMAIEPPTLAEEALLAIRTDAHGGHIGPRRLWIRSVGYAADGTIVCKYSYRTRRNGGGIPGRFHQGKWLLIAIPRTDAPIEFRRVP